jgi:hypothetical protein
MKIKRIFLAHPKGLDDGELEALRQRAQGALEKLSAGRAAVQVTLGKDDFDARWSTLGSWEAWAKEVAIGVGWADREPRYHAIVVVDKRLGNATRLIVQHAMAAGKPVLRLHEDEMLTVVQAVVQVGESWKDGWEVT